MKILWDILRAAGFALVVLAFMASFFGIVAGYPAYHALRSWPVTDATVLQSAINSRSGHSFTGRGLGRPIYGATLLFHYRVNTQECVVRQEVSYFGASESEMANLVRRYREGSRQSIRYDPENPLRISLARGFDSVSFAATLAVWRWAAILAAIGVALFALGKKFGK